MKKDVRCENLVNHINTEAKSFHKHPFLFLLLCVKESNRGDDKLIEGITLSFPSNVAIL